MIPYSSVILAICVAQAAASLLVALVMFSLWRRYRSQNLLFWSLSFACLLLFVGGKALSLWSYEWTSQAARAGLATSTMLFGVLQPVFLLWGALGLARGVDLKLTRLRWVLAGLALAVFGMAALAQSVDVEWRLPVRVGTCVSVSIACLFAAAIGIRNGPGHPLRLAKVVVATGFLLYCGSQLVYFAAALPLDLGPWSRWAWSVGFADVVAQATVGLGLIVWHLDEEHERAERAWSATRLAEQDLARAQRLELVGRLTGRLAHDYNNILTSVLGHSEMARTELGGGNPVKHLDTIDELVGRASSLTRQVLEVGRVRETCSRRVSLAEQLARREEMLRHLLAPEVSLRIDVEQGTPEVDADPDQIEQVVLNLSLNARDAMGPGGVLSIFLAGTEIDSERASKLQVENVQF